ncbi:glutamyl-tRNA reductase [Anaerococcus hydrogenalis]|uniref:Glutamyl-tRNA reductase n=1 Tax=Anaerococcus hydrogenalis TaxID=33029 RepID=A0A2N6UIX7_9FIRM|nr:glutamyl-tRNA reductase [Anaerococcus hydrogenalis]MDK7694980.1 glutamyl-tRNA reductase [Anaerococcus hydrogenalis]MDK7696466.1 glutamyl-tRNA reductase [Anaerococcus hydrogenalis]MDK7708007.1 glutamyl-tRNA reductase [Anaerococcus hydrogenalis]PMC81610.1 glutamyl-tRNA reductase [Anaerococcus hydrogenalis]
MFFYSFGLNHHKAGIDIREKVHFKDSDIIDASEILENEGFDEVVILSTCNRSEIFALTSEDKFSDEFFVKFFENYFSLGGLSSFIFIKKDLDAINHLFSLTCGLDSLIVGEDQILGQASDAYETSLSLGFCKKILSEALKRAINLSKNIKSDSNISHIPLSLPYIAVKKAQEFDDLSNKKALVVGIGNIGKLCIENLMETGADIYISNWNMDKSIKIQKEYENINIISYEKIQENLGDMDFVFSATASPHLVLKKEHFKNINKEINIFDLALPRDCDPEISKISNVNLLDIDSIKDISRKNLDKRRKILQSYRVDIDKKSKEFYKWMKEVKIDYILKDLNDRCDDLADKTMDYIFRKTDMTGSQKKKVDKAVRNALKKIARDPVLTFKENHGEDFEKTLKILTKVYKK